MDQTGQITVEIIEQIRDNPAKGLEEFVERYGGRLLIFVRYKLGDRLKTRVDPEDVLQDFFASLVTNAQGFLDKVGERGVHRAAFRLLENRIKDLYEHHFKTKKRSAMREVRESPIDAGSRGFALSQVAGSTASFSRRIEANDEFRSLSRLLQHLEEDSRELFVLKFVEECTNQEIADSIGVSLSTVKRDSQDLVQQIHRLRRRLGA